jgi:hypothetical protein
MAYDVVFGFLSQTKANDFEGVGGPGDKAKQAEIDRPGDDDVTGNVRQGAN